MSIINTIWDLGFSLQLYFYWFGKFYPTGINRKASLPEEIICFLSTPLYFTSANFRMGAEQEREKEKKYINIL